MAKDQSLKEQAMRDQSLREEMATLLGKAKAYEEMKSLACGIAFDREKTNEGCKNCNGMKSLCGALEKKLEETLVLHRKLCFQLDNPGE